MGNHGPGKTYPYVYEPEYSDYEDIGNEDVDNCARIRMYYVYTHDNTLLMIHDAPAKGPLPNPVQNRVTSWC